MEKGHTLVDRLHASGYLNKTEQEIFDAASKLIESEFYDYFLEAEHEAPGGNGSAVALAREFPVPYKIVATAVHIAIFLLGLLGNGILLVAACRSKSLHTPTYYYLVSLACADLLVIITAIPEALIGHHVGKQWLLGSVECALFIFLNFMGINAGSVSIFTFTVERYIAVCHPLLAYRVCTLRRTKTIILFSWIMVLGYCCPWLMLTEVRPDVYFPERKQCHFRMDRHYYQPFFIADLTFFYLLPLFTALFAYIKIALVIRQRRALPLRKSPNNSVGQGLVDTETPERFTAVEADGESVISVNKSNSTGKLIKARICQELRRQGNAPGVPKMLVVVVILFAISWLPFRLILVYNSFVVDAWLNLWFLFFAKTFIYLNCAVNPILYNIMSHRFRFAVRKTLCCQSGRSSNVASVITRPPSRSRDVRQWRKDDTAKDMSRRTSFCRPLAPSPSLQWMQMHIATPLHRQRPHRSLVRTRAQSRYRSPWSVASVSRQTSITLSVSNNSSFRSLAASDSGNVKQMFRFNKPIRHIDSESILSSRAASTCRGFMY